MDNGSIVHVDYDLYNASNDKLIETTREEVAKEHDIHDENREYSPMITTVGDGRLIPVRVSPGRSRGWKGLRVRYRANRRLWG